jgi:hypothetical protein
METVLERIQTMGSNGVLRIDGLWLEELPPLPATVKSLVCSRNQLTRLPALPEGLESLYCYSNTLTSLPPLPASLKILDCGQNELTSLPTLPLGIKELSCYQNHLTKLPQLPHGVRILKCYENELVRLPRLPTTLQQIECDMNPFKQPLKGIVEKFSAEIRRGINPKAQRILVKRFIFTVNLKEDLIAKKYNEPKVNKMVQELYPEGMTWGGPNTYGKNYEKMGEVWTEGVGQAYGPWKKGGYKHSGVRKTRKRQSRFRKFTRKHLA